MGALSQRDLHLDKILSQMALGYKPTGHIADFLLPIVKVDKQSDYYTEQDRARKLRRQETERAPGTEAHRIDQPIGSGTFFCRNYALKASVTIEDRANADAAYLLDIINGRVELVQDDLSLDREIRMSNLVTSGSNVGSSTGVASAWNGTTTNPLGDMNTAIDNVRYANGVRPNVIAYGPQAWDSWRRDSTVRNLVNGANNGGGYLNEAQTRNLLNIDKILLAEAFQNTAEENIAEALSTIWADKVLIAYIAPSPGREKPSFGYSFRWVKPGLPNMQVERHPYSTKTKSEEVEVGYYQDEKITGASYAFLLDAVNSST